MIARAGYRGEPDLNREIAVAVVVGNNPDTIVASMASYYDRIERIVVTADIERTWSQTNSLAAETLDRIRDFDRDRRVEILTGNFHSNAEPLRNETEQRQFMSNWLKDEKPIKWVLQVDCDEIFLDLDAILFELNRRRFLEQYRAQLICAYNWTLDGRLLVVVEKTGEFAFETVAVAHRPGAIMERCRQVRTSTAIRTRFFPPTKIAPLNPAMSMLHLSYARKEEFIREKLESWGHSTQIDRENLLRLWRRSRSKWMEIRDFHPLDPPRWPALKAYSISDLCRETRSQIPQIVLTEDVLTGLRGD